MQYSIPLQPIPVYQQETPVSVTVAPVLQPVTVVPTSQTISSPLLETQTPYVQPIPTAIPAQPQPVYFMF